MYIILTQCFPSRVGGIESLISNLAISIGQNNNLTVFADQHNYLNDTIYDDKYKSLITIKRYGGLKFFRRRKKANELKIFINNNKIDAVFADTWKSLELCVDDLNKKNIPISCLAHGNELLTNSIKKRNRIISTLKKSSSIIANSNYTAGLVKELTGNKINISVVYPGANDLRRIKAEKFLKFTGDPILLTLSRLEKRKGHIFILKSIIKLKKKFPNIKYIIAGEGNEKAILKNYVLNNNLSKNVIFTGSVNDEQKKYLFENTNLMIMPTVDEAHNESIEGFGIAYIEAAFFGIPSLASNVGGTPEAVINDKTGVIINHHDELFETLNYLLSDKEKLKFLGINAKERAEKKFNWENVSLNYIKKSFV